LMDGNFLIFVILTILEVIYHLLNLKYNKIVRWRNDDTKSNGMYLKW